MKFLKSMFLNSGRALSVIAGMFFLLGFTACDQEEEDLVEPASIAYVSLYNASPNTPGLDISVDNRQINTYSFDYTDNTGYLRFFTGDRMLRFSPYGANNVTLDTVTTFEQGKAYSVFLTGDYPELEAVIINDNAPEPAVGKANVRIIHLSPDAGHVNFQDAEASSLVIENKGYKDYTEFTEVDASIYDFKVTNEAGTETLLDIPDIGLTGGLYYTIVIRGYENPPSGSDHFLSAEVLVN